MKDGMFFIYQILLELNRIGEMEFLEWSRTPVFEQPANLCTLERRL
jgi:hypothetical protein